METTKMNKFKKLDSVYELSLISRNIVLNMNSIGENLQEIIEKIISSNYEGKCIVEGYIKPGSSEIISYSSGLITGDNVSFEVVFQCQICYPVEGMLINCIAKNITKAGIRAISADEGNGEEYQSPFIVFVAKDHHHMNEYFSTIQENSRFVVKVIGQRFELNDKYISIIGELTKQKPNYKK
jgi:DNA-directed RNA polymerase subunit E'/Rpb7